MSAYYPIFLDLHGRRVVIVGGGNVSERKVVTMLRYGAQITVIAPDVTEEIARLADGGDITLHRRSFETGDLDGAQLVIASTSAPAVNEAVAAECREKHILVNVIDATPLCDFIVPAIVDHGSIQLAVSTGGRSPAFARVVKRALERAIGPEYAELNDLLGSLRDAAKASPALPTDDDRKRFFDRLIALGVLEMLRDGRRAEAYAEVARLCEAHQVRASALLQSRLAESG